MKNGNGKVTVKNVTELRDDMLKAYGSLASKPMAPEELNAICQRTRVAAQVLKSAGVELKYRQARKEYPVIPFLGEAVAA